MIKRLLRGAFYLLIAAALVHFGFALAIEYGVRTVPIWPGYVMDLPFQSDAPTRIGMILAGISVLFYMVSRVQARPTD